MNKMILCAAMISTTGAFAQHDQFEYRSFHSSNDTLDYRVLFPNDFDEAKKYPLLVFLHGAGERGSDNASQLIHGGKLFADSIARYPAVVVFPQCPRDDYWPNVEIEETEEGRVFSFPGGDTLKTALHLTGQLIDSIMQQPFIDISRIYLGGLSRGAMGTFELVSKKPDTFAAAFAICGGGNAEATRLYAETTPFWIFHGEDDEVVDVIHSKNMHKAILDAGGSPRLTIYPGVNHNSWDNAFAEPKLLSWIFSKQK